MRMPHGPGAQKLASLLDRDPAMAALFAPPAAEADVDARIRDLGLDLPDAFRELHRIAAGTARTDDGEAKLFEDEGLVLHSLAGVAKWKSFWDDLTRDYATRSDDERKATWGHALWNPAWLPIAQGIFGVYALATEPCFGGPAGQVVCFGSDDPRWKIVSESLDDFLGLIAGAIAMGARRLDTETLLALHPDARYVDLIPGEAGAERFDRPAKRLAELADDRAASAPAKPASLAERIERTASARGVDVDELRASVVAAVDAAAREVFGEGRRVDTFFDEDAGEIALYFMATVVEQVTKPGLELAIEGVHTQLDPDAALGDELGIQIFYLEGQEAQARAQEELMGPLFALDDAYRRAFDRLRALAPDAVERALAQA